MDREAKQTTLLLNGWSAMRFRQGAMYGSGMCHPAHGSVREDFYNKSHGPTVAPLVWYAWDKKINGTYPDGNNISFGDIPDYTFGRLWDWWVSFRESLENGP